MQQNTKMKKRKSYDLGILPRGLNSPGFVFGYFHNLIQKIQLHKGLFSDDPFSRRPESIPYFEPNAYLIISHNHSI